MSSALFARSATASAFARFQHGDWRPTFDQVPAQRQGPTEQQFGSAAKKHATATLSRRVRFTKRNPLAGQPRRVRPEFETHRSEPMHMVMERDEFDNNRHWRGHRDRHVSNFEAELHELDIEMERAHELGDEFDIREEFTEMVDDPEIATFVEELERQAA